MPSPYYQLKVDRFKRVCHAAKMSTPIAKKQYSYKGVPVNYSIYRISELDLRFIQRNQELLSRERKIIRKSIPNIGSSYIGICNTPYLKVEPPIIIG